MGFPIVDLHIIILRQLHYSEKFSLKIFTGSSRVNII